MQNVRQGLYELVMSSLFPLFWGMTMSLRHRRITFKGEIQIIAPKNVPHL